MFSAWLPTCLQPLFDKNHSAFFAAFRQFALAPVHMHEWLELLKIHETKTGTGEQGGGRQDASILRALKENTSPPFKLRSSRPNRVDEKLRSLNDDDVSCLADWSQVCSKFRDFLDGGALPHETKKKNQKGPFLKRLDNLKIPRAVSIVMLAVVEEMRRCRTKFRQFEPRERKRVSSSSSDMTGGDSSSRLGTGRAGAASVVSGGGGGGGGMVAAGSDFDNDAVDVRPLVRCLFQGWSLNQWANG
uniref:Uncharacterized protein n=1 Tax=Chromera velia CCMP2878 TaxID=1169474 RepID=A0A0G4GUQ7_9ALVE|eukprot:Cvel_23466.t1-p1 / transcript=Cvel_23466.t1 / gene=Cvel_23466 / organism=Chromera_velia_CCMP2878 / gene_product=hypothetical protein / transcript_product=hypothetical protein / location=Cvel_scaffold2420:25351-28402(-) / protein_length=244 / sequence_SO=supercontig / SO=protein_coding / is_pseudo=false